MKAKLEAMAAEWRERGHWLQRRYGKQAPMQVAAAQGALEACAEELEKAVQNEEPENSPHPTLSQRERENRLENGS